MKYKYVEFRTSIIDLMSYSVFNHKEDYLGEIKKTRVGRFQHWCFYPDNDTYYTNGCLKEIVSFISTLYSKKNGRGD
ncbi:hypothetical protein K8R33_02950 [archaeon]|nr:hypothetical protein [archaeon]